MNKITLLLMLIIYSAVGKAQTTVDCSTGPVNTTYCYLDNDTTSFSFVSSDGTSLILNFNAGQLEVDWDELVVLDSDGTELYNGYGNNGELAGLNFQSSGDSITVSINSDTTINCSDNNYTPWDFDVSCNTCTNPSVVYNIIDDCDTSGGYFVNVQVNDLGSANSLTLSDNQASTDQNISTTGSIQFGPYTNGTNVIINVQNNDDVNCRLNSPTLTQANCPPPSPVGISCASDNSIYIFTEEFNAAGGWTGDLNNDNGTWEIPDGSTSSDTGPSIVYSGTNFMNYEASGNTTATASAVSPAIDLTTATDGAELSFYMHAYGSDMGTLNVNVGTSVNGPFTTLLTLDGEYQNSGVANWIPVGVNLDAYLGEIIYIELNHTGTGTGFEGDMSIDYLRIETCGTFCIAPSNLTATAITGTSAAISWTPNSNETSWEYAIQVAGGAQPSSGTSINMTSFNASGLTPETTYEVFVRADCSSNSFSNWSVFSFTTGEDLSSYPITFANSPINTSEQYDIALVDLNGDFLDDVVSVGSTNINVHYQLASGGFNEVDITTTPADDLPTWSLAAGDFDKNGYNDLLYGSGSGVTFMKANATGTGYTEISTGEYVFSQRSNFVDINTDGHLDAFVCHDVDPNVYYINDGSGNLTFYQGESSGVVPNGLGLTPGGGNYGTVWIDFDNDRDMDLFIAKCRGGSTTISTNELWRNDGNGVFTNIADSNNWYTNNYPSVGHNNSSNLGDNVQTWSSAWADFDNDGDMDVYVGASNATNGDSKLMRNNGDGTFTDITSGSGVLDAQLGIENAPADFDNDGNVDILSNGNILFGNGDLTFINYSNNVPPSGAIGDVNNDGFLDVFRNGQLYVSNTNTNNWLKINTVGTVSNINGIGARVEIITPSGTQIRDVRSGEGFEFMSSLNTHFGLGTDSSITEIRVYWPSGIVDVIQNPNINNTLTIVEGSSPLSLDDESLSRLSIYPNPVENILTIEASANLTDMIASVFDINGKRIVSHKLKSNTLDVSFLEAGIYFLRLETNGRTMKHKFIKK
ncbi:FG-GAP-like repeat-containing protein [uncultured Winogradskyella sp.]|uniref:FG-GAP-like repeat-containing protein n=1 Tax=uncultured Winogradskyella sp. TaxID=395353 RepID=UPI0026033F59|nr:FG-GAP-like repeat-containing protein [uncultured Winogradskyella sp.]